MPDRRLQVAAVLPELVASPIQRVRSQYDPVLPVDDDDGGIESLRRHVLGPPFVEPSHIVYQPHVTLVHPRTVTADGLREAWSELAGWSVLNQATWIDSVAVIAASGDGPVAMETYSLATA